MVFHTLNNNEKEFLIRPIVLREIIRILDSLLLIESHPLATPVNWKFGSETFVLPWITEQEKRTHFDDVRHEQLPTGKDYVQYGSPKLTEKEQEILHTSKIAENVKSVDGLSTPVSCSLIELL